MKVRQLIADAAKDLNKIKVPSVLITGGNRGLGFEFSYQYLADSWRRKAECL